MFLDINDARVIMNDLAWGKPVNHIDRGGGKDSNGALVARVLKIERKEDRVWIQLQNGVGEEFAGGIIRLKGGPWAEISIPLEIFDSRKMAFAVLDYMRAWDVAKWMRSELYAGNSAALFRSTGIVR